MVERNPISEKFCTKDSTSGLFCKSGIDSFRKSKPIKRKAKPKMNSPIDFRLLFEEKISGNPIPSSGMESMLMENFPNPKSEIIHAVTVVPMLAPIITPMDCAKESKPAFTKLTTITVVADEDCTNAVMRMPVRTPNMRFLVIADKMSLSLFPASFCRPSLIIFIPNKKSPKEPTSFKKSKKV